MIICVQRPEAKLLGDRVSRTSQRCQLVGILTSKVGYGLDRTMTSILFLPVEREERSHSMQRGQTRKVDPI